MKVCIIRDSLRAIPKKEIKFGSLYLNVFIGFWYDSLMWEETRWFYKIRMYGVDEMRLYRTGNLNCIYIKSESTPSNPIPEYITY